MSACAIKIQVIDEDDVAGNLVTNSAQIETFADSEDKMIAKKKPVAKKAVKKTAVSKKISKKTSVKNSEILAPAETAAKQQKDESSASAKISAPQGKPSSALDILSGISTKTKTAAVPAPEIKAEPVAEPVEPAEPASAEMPASDNAPAEKKSILSILNSSAKAKIIDSGVESKEMEIEKKAEIVNKEISKSGNGVEAPNTPAEGGRVKNLIAQMEEDRSKQDTGVILPQAEDNQAHFSHSIKIYKKIAYFFGLAVIVFIGFFAYYFFHKITITLIPNQERISNNMIFDIRDQDTAASESGNTIIGIVKKVEVSTAKEYQASGTEVIGKEVAGKATIYNNYTKNQPLVASTRLLSADDKLFRTKNTVNVPAGGSVEVEIYADNPGPDAAVGPTKFSIPGLWAGLQDKIFAETKESIDYKQKVKKYIVQTDIDDGIRDLKQQLLTDAKAQINEQYKDYGEVIYKINEDTVKSEADKKAGEEAEAFNITMTAEVVVVAFNEEKTAAMAKQKFLATLSENKELISFDENNIIYALNNFDVNQGTANVNATFEGKISVKDNFDIIEVDKIVGLNQKQLEVYLKNITEIAGYEIKYTPSFLKRVPNLVDKIKIEIKK